MLCAMASASTWAGSTRIGTRNEQLPELKCDFTTCRLNYETARSGAGFSPQVASPLPDVIAPPAGQRMLWRGAGFPTCQSIIGYSPSSPYSYMSSIAVDVPLGSSHVSLLATYESAISGSSASGAGMGASGGMLQVRRTGGTWYNASTGYAYTVQGGAIASNHMNPVAFMGLVDLTTLPGGSGVPTSIEVRMATFPVTAGDFSYALNSVCKGQLQLTF